MVLCSSKVAGYKAQLPVLVVLCRGNSGRPVPDASAGIAFAIVDKSQKHRNIRLGLRCRSRGRCPAKA